jgi:N utilization substance protein B
MTKSAPNNYRKKSAARLAAVQILYHMELRKISPEEALKNFQENYMGKNIEEEAALKPDTSLMTRIVLGSQERQADLDAMISSTLTDAWKIERLEKVVLAILRAGTYELLMCPETDTSIIISEYLDVTEAFHEDKEIKFVNASLNRLAKTIREK